MAIDNVRIHREKRKSVSNRSLRRQFCYYYLRPVKHPREPAQSSAYDHSAVILIITALSIRGEESLSWTKYRAYKRKPHLPSMRVAR